MNFIFLIFLIAVQGLWASETVNEYPWPGTEVGSIDCFSQTVPGRSVKPGDSGVLVFSCLLSNGKGSSAITSGGIGQPNIATIKFTFTGSSVDSDYLRTRLYFDYDGVFNGNESEFITGTVRSTNNNSFFPSNYSPAPVQNSKSVFGSLGSDEMGLFHGWKTRLFLYLTADFSTNIIDQGTVSVQIPGVNLLWRMEGAGITWEQNMVTLNTIGSIACDVTGSNLVIEGEPQDPGIASGSAFDITVRVKDQYGNIDRDFTGNIWLSSSDPQAVLPYTLGSPYNMTAADHGVKTFSGIRLYSGPSVTIRVSDGDITGLIDGISKSILVISDVDHFTITHGTNNLPSGVIITAGESLASAGITNLRVSAYNYLNFINSNFNGDIYFTSSAHSAFNYYKYSSQNPYRFAGSADNGVKEFTAADFTLTRAGIQNFIVTDGSHKGEWLDIKVNPAGYALLSASLLSASNLAEIAVPVRLMAYDRFSNQLNNLSSVIDISVKKDGFYPADAVYPGGVELTHQGLELKDASCIIIRESGNYRLFFTDRNNPLINCSLDVDIKVNINKKNSIIPVNNFVKGASGQVVLYYELKDADGAEAEVAVYNIHGKRVRKFNLQNVKAGFNELLAWDTSDDSGNPVSSGQYIIRISGRNINASSAFVVVVR